MTTAKEMRNNTMYYAETTEQSNNLGLGDAINKASRVFNNVTYELHNDKLKCKVWPKHKDENGNMVGDILSVDEICTYYKDYPTGKMIQEGILQYAGSVFVLNFDRPHELPNKTVFRLDEIEGIGDDIGEIGLKCLNCNRYLKYKDVETIKNSMDEHGIKQTICILDKDANTYDGQTRIAAAIALGLYVYIIVTTDEDPEMIMKINSHSNCWDTHDIIHGYMVMEQEGIRKGDNYTKAYKLLHLYEDETSTIYKNAYKRVKKMYEKSHYTITEKGFSKLIKACNLDRTAMVAIVNNLVWAGSKAMTDINEGKLIITEDTYNQVFELLTTTFVDFIAHMAISAKNCKKVIKLSDDKVPSKQSYMRSAFFQSAFIKLFGTKNEDGNMLGDRMDIFNEFIQSIKVEPHKSKQRIIGLKIKDFSSTIRTDSTLLYEELLDNFNSWFMLEYAPKYGIEYNTRMKFS